MHLVENDAARSSTGIVIAEYILKRTSYLGYLQNDRSDNFDRDI